MRSVVAKKWKFRFLSFVCLPITLLWGLSTGSYGGFRRDNNPDATSNVNTLGPPHGPQTSVLGPRTPVNPPNVGYHGEVMAAADPQSPNNLIVCGYRANQRTGAGYEGYVYQSGDGGKTWREVLVDASSQWVSEESCAFGPGHQAYFVTGVSDTSRGEPLHEYGNMHLYRSADGGRTWRTIQVSPFMDWTSMAVDTTHGPRRNTLYIFADSVASATGGWLYDDRSAVLAVRRELPKSSFSITNGNFSVKTGGKSTARLPEGSAVLSDGSVLTVFSGDRGTHNHDASGKNTTIFSVEVGVSRDGGKTLTRTSVYESLVPSVLGGLAVNQATDEIYICWTPRYGESTESRMMDHEESNLVLATSRDRGQTWTVRSVKAPLDGALDVSPGTASLAVNKDGVLGFMWYGKDWGRVYFGPSFDGGDSIAEVATLTPTSPIEQLQNRSLADERRLMVYPPAWNDSLHRLEPLKVLAFGPNPRGVPFGNPLVADEAGTFHPIWSEVGNGESQLWTRTVSLQGQGNNMPTVTGLEDISDKVVSKISNVRYDHLESLVAFDLTVTNKSDSVIAALLVTVVTSPSGQLDFAAENADNRELSNGALWELGIPSDGLGCEQSSDPRTLTFRMNMRNEEDGLGYFNGRDIPLRIYGRLTSSPFRPVNH